MDYQGVGVLVADGTTPIYTPKIAPACLVSPRLRYHQTSGRMRGKRRKAGVNEQTSTRRDDAEELTIDFCADAMPYAVKRLPVATFSRAENWRD